VYGDQTAVVGPLALRHEPGCYDLCQNHAVGLSVPRGWDVIRLPLDDTGAEHSVDDLLALAEAVREVGFRQPIDPTVPPQVLEGRRKGHLVVVPEGGR
jgi:hypothetical protein